MSVFSVRENEKEDVFLCSTAEVKTNGEILPNSKRDAVLHGKTNTEGSFETGLSFEAVTVTFHILHILHNFE
jgi:hypothetical protein